MKKTLIIKPLKPNRIADTQLIWRFDNDNKVVEIPFGALLLQSDDTKLNTYIEHLRNEQLSLGNENFAVEDERQEKDMSLRTVDEKKEAEQFNQTMKMLKDKFGEKVETQITPLKITQNEGNLFLCVRYAIDCSACRTIELCENEDTDSPEFAQQLHKLGWKSEDGETAICPNCIQYSAKLKTLQF